jgi:xylulose-5-phosphate/fructose-6-phosphate phosphoketolase
MVNQHAKWIEKSLEVSWRQAVSSLNILLTSTVWRQDHNGFTHQVRECPMSLKKRP